MMMTLGQAHRLLPGSQLLGDPTCPLQRVHSDTRSLQPGDFFVALRGERFDAHDFLPQARAAGAVAALAERGLAEAGLPGLLVPDTLQALQALARAWRQHLHLPLIAVTGSNGKTTVTQMVASILRAGHDDRALSTQGNFNNHIGVPLTLLRLRQDDRLHHQVAVLELGMNHPGEIAVLAQLAQPSVVLVNNAQREHQEFMDGVDAVARENGSALQALPPSGVAVWPAADPMDALWAEQAAGRRVLRFTAGLADEVLPQAEVTVRGQWQAKQQAWQATLNLGEDAAAFELHAPGVHNLRNAAAAAACAWAVGESLATIAQGLSAFAPVSGRSQVESLSLDGQTLTLVNDSYNANPDSVLAAIEVLKSLPGPHWLVLGDMGEVGDQGPAFHAEVGERAAQRGIEHLWLAGAASAHGAAAAQAAGSPARHFASVDELLAQLGSQRPRGVRSVLVKGSRFMRMERVVHALQALAAGPEQGEHRAA